MLNRHLHNDLSDNSHFPDTNEVRYTERKRNFGQLVKTLRKEKGWKSRRSRKSNATNTD